MGGTAAANLAASVWICLLLDVHYYAQPVEKH